MASIISTLIYSYGIIQLDECLFEIEFFKCLDFIYQVFFFVSYSTKIYIDIQSKNHGLSQPSFTSSMLQLP